MTNRDKLCGCKYHHLAGLCMRDKCGLTGNDCILAQTTIVYVTPETKEWFGNYSAKAVPVHHECAVWEGEDLPPLGVA